ncbi:NACHT domain-containing protein [Streptomyces albipurpureus]|uniref:NACHT domain-containing protein n=1 Tax=Streptomyces albipurpureus TaxID=2897419 RepID=A0ABT0UHI4_9ACTN|nr:NACHT domain-containing protein [Streptomyces sp. CWNU-1]MCM2386933.1 NACHT domain-containing protein [Streptomyces sp. CWNU-1]
MRGQLDVWRARRTRPVPTTIVTPKNGGYAANLTQTGRPDAGPHLRTDAPGPSKPRPFGTVVALLLVTAGASLALWGADSHGKGPNWLGAGVLIVGVLPWVGAGLTRRNRVFDLDTERLDSAAAQLGGWLRTAYDQEERRSRIHEPVPLQLRWGPGDPLLVDHWKNISLGSSQLPDLGGEFDDINDVFHRLPSRRLVVLGAPGAGKSVLALRLARRALGKGPVPVVLPLASWQPGGQGLWQWAAEQLAERHPRLADSADERTAIALALLESGRVLPVLDGWDEIPTAVQASAFREFSASLRSEARFVLTSRTDAYARVVAECGVLSAAAVIELERLTVAQLAEHLPRTSRPTSAAGRIATKWDPVLDRLRQGGDGGGDARSDTESDRAAHRLRTALATPLMVQLARAAYSDTQADPAELLDDTARFPDHHAIEAHLIDRFLPSVYAGALADRRWDPAAAEGWLRFLARHIRAGSTQELEWWRLDLAAPRWAGPLGFLPSIVAMTAIAYGIGLGAARTTAVPAGRVWPTLALLALVALVVGWRSIDPAALPAPRRWRARISRPLPLTEPADTSAATPWEVLRQDRTTALLTGVQRPLSPDGWLGALRTTLILTPIAVLLWLLSAGADTPGDRTWAAPALLGLIAWLLYGVALSAWGRYTVARIYLAGRGKLPWRLSAFLQDAHRRGVLRQSGGRYRFRHRELLHRLSGDTVSLRPAASQGGRRAGRVGLEVGVGLTVVVWLGAAAVHTVGSAGPVRAVAPACSLLTTAQLAPAISDPYSRPAGPTGEADQCQWSELAPFHRDVRVELTITVTRPDGGRSALTVADRRVREGNGDKLTGVGDAAVADTWSNGSGPGAATASVRARAKNVVVDLRYSEQVSDQPRVISMAGILTRQVLHNAGLGPSPGVALSTVSSPVPPTHSPYSRYRRESPSSLVGPVWQPTDRSQLLEVDGVPLVFRAPRTDCESGPVCGIRVTGAGGEIETVPGSLKAGLRPCGAAPCDHQAVERSLRDRTNPSTTEADWSWADSTTAFADVPCRPEPSVDRSGTDDPHCVELVRAISYDGRHYLLELRTTIAKEHADVMRKTVNDLYTQSRPPASARR